MDPERVLIVDDDESLLYMMTSHLERQGYSVESTPNPFQGLELVKTKGPFAVLVTDLMMPVMDGVQLLRKARQVDPRLEAIVITASASIETAIAAMREDGAYNYLMKPLENINELSLAVKRAAAYRRLQLEREALQARALADAERLHLLITNIGDAILSADVQGKLTVVNPAAERLLGRSNLIGCEALTSLPRPLAILLSNWHATSAQRAAVIEITWPGTATQMVSLTPIVDALDEVAGWVMVIRDITHLKQLDELRTQTLTDTANRIHLPLVQAMNLLTELSTPALPPDRLSRVVYQLVRTWQRIQQWADELLELVQYESGTSVTKTVVNPTQVLNEVMMHLPQDAVYAKRLRLETSLPADLSPVRTDAAMLRKALQGLLTRAIARSEVGSVVHVALREREGQIWIDISDGGSPIAEMDLPHAFERSFVSSNSGFDSTGLELATAKTIIDKLGGQVWLRSLGTMGSTVTICLPTPTDQSAVSSAATNLPVAK